MAAEMTTDTIRVSAVIPAPPERVYAAWLDDAEHSAITRSTASVEPWVGGRHSAWGGSIRGTTLELQPNRRIVQSWWASDFPPGSEESRVEVLFEPVPGGTLVTINHTGLPHGRGHRYEDGWKDFYLDSMRQYFPAHPTPPPREEGMAPVGSAALEAPAAKRAGARSAARGATSPRRATPGQARARTPAAKKKAARKPAARKAAPRKAAPRKATPRKAASRPARAAARKAAPKARKTAGRAGTRRGR